MAFRDLAAIACAGGLFVLHMFGGLWTAEPTAPKAARPDRQPVEEMAVEEEEPIEARPEVRSARQVPEPVDRGMLLDGAPRLPIR